MAEVLVIGKKISEMGLVNEITGEEKIPTSALGDKAVTTGQLLTYVNNNGVAQWGRIGGDITNQVDLQNQFTQQLATLQNHIQDQGNPHNVTKEQVGLGLVDNTADMDKPVSTAVQEALSLKADQTYVDDSLTNKTHNSLLGRDADGAHPARAILDGSGVTQQQVNDLTGAPYRIKVGGYNIGERVVLESGDIVKSTVANNTNDPNVDMAGWVGVNDSSQIIHEGKTQYEINESLNGLTFTPDLPENRRLQVIAGSIRNTGDGWKWISDAAHTPVGVTPTITTSGVNLVINYGFTAKRVVTLLATPDETLAGLGIIVGGSVGTAFTNLQLKAPLAFTVNTETAELTIPSYHINTISATLASGSCSITHPSVGMTGDAPTVTKLGSTGGHTEVLVSYGTTQSILYGSGDLDGQIIYNGTAWVYTGELKTIPTVEWVTSEADAYLRVVHQQTDIFNINIHSKTPYDLRPISVNGTEFRVRFYDTSGTLQLNPNTEMQFLFSRKACLPKNTIRGLYAVRRGYAGILPSDLISASGNIWIYGVMEVDS